MNQLSKPNLLTAMISASISLVLTGQSATAANRTIPFSSLSTDGASAKCRFAILNTAASLYCQLSDNRRDGNNPYVEWQVDSYGSGDVYYRGAAFTTGVVTDRTSVSTYIGIVSWRVCRDVANTNSDNCSAWLIK